MPEKVLSLNQFIDEINEHRITAVRPLATVGTGSYFLVKEHQTGFNQVINVTGLRAKLPQHWDRNPTIPGVTGVSGYGTSPYGVTFSGIAGPHGYTTRASYTVPAGRIATV